MKSISWLALERKLCYSIFMLCRLGLEQLDGKLASLSRLEGALTLRIGQCLEALGRPDVSGSTGYAELGFSAMAEYVHERVERSPRWAEAARCMARRLEKLPQSRGALAGGVVSFSMAEQVARIATLENEAEWLSRAEKLTVREMRKLVRAELARRAAPASPGDPARDGEREQARERAAEMVTLCLMVDQEDVWLWHATKTLMEVGLDTHGPDEQAGALLGETMSTLMNCLPDGVIDWCALSEEVPGWRDPREASYRLMRGKWQAEAEERCERGVTESMREKPPAAVMDSVARLAALGSATLDGLPPSALDREVRTLARRLAAQDLELARGAPALSPGQRLAAPRLRERAAVCTGAAGALAVAGRGAPVARAQAREAAGGRERARARNPRSRGRSVDCAGRDARDRARVARAGSAADDQAPPGGNQCGRHGPAGERYPRLSAADRPGARHLPGARAGGGERAGALGREGRARGGGLGGRRAPADS